MLIVLCVTIVVGAISISWALGAGKSPDALREIFLALLTGEIGLIAGLQRGS